MNTPQTVPKWFVWFLSAALTAAGPWGMWVSHTIIRIDERSQIYHESTASTAAGMAVLERRLNEHLADPNPHATVSRDLQRQIDANLQRLERLEKGLMPKL